MALFRFRTRNPQRDRHEKVTANAAFSQQLVEDERGSVGIPAKSDDLTGTMIQYTKRLASLQTRIDFVTDLERGIEAFSQVNAGGRAVA